MMQLSMAHGLTGNVGYLTAKVRYLERTHCKIPRSRALLFEFRCQSNSALLVTCQSKISVRGRLLSPLDFFERRRRLYTC